MFCLRFSFPPVITCFSMLSINHDVNSSTVSYPNKVTNRITQSPFPCSFLNNSSLLYYTTLTIYILKRHNNNIIIIINNKTTFAISTHIIQMIIVPTRPFHTVLFLIASSSSLFHAINAQPETPRAVHYISNQPFTILLVVIAIAFFITLFFSFYIRHCSETYLVSGTTPIGFGPKGLDPQVLATFPILLYSTVKAGQNAALQCAVCLSEFVDSDKLRLLPKCSHVFHPNCIDAWLASHVTCPVCRAYLNADRAEVTLEIEHENVAHQVFDGSYVRSGNGGNEGGIRGNVDGCIGKDNGSSKMRAFGVLVRSHSTGHSLVELHKKDMERFTQRLSEEVRKLILDYDKRGGRGNLIMKRSVSYGFLQGEEGCSGKGWWGRSEGGEGSSKGENKGWILSMTPPFVSRGLSSSGVTQNASTTCSGIPMFWASSIVREDKESDSRTIFQVL